MKFAVNSFIIASLVSGIEAFGSSFAPSSNKLHRVESASSLKMSLEQYSDELKETAAKMVRPGFGLLACDESTGTVGARLESIGLENNEDNRRTVSVVYLRCSLGIILVHMFPSLIFGALIKTHCIHSGVSFFLPLLTLVTMCLELFSLKKLFTKIPLKENLSWMCSTRLVLFQESRLTAV